MQRAIGILKHHLHPAHEAAVAYLRHGPAVDADRLLVMKDGYAVEETDRAALAALSARDPYTRALLEANAYASDV